jgi:hypothetical protein
MTKTVFLFISICFSLTATAEFRTWNDRNGNSIEAEFVRVFGGKVVIRDKAGKTYKFDPLKLSDTDQLYLNPPPKKPKEFKIGLSKSSQQTAVERNEGEEITITTFNYLCALSVKSLGEKELPDGLKGFLFVVGTDDVNHYVVLDKVDSSVDVAQDSRSGKITGNTFEIKSIRHDDKKKNGIKGIRYTGYIVMLFSDDGTVLEKQCSHSFLDHKEKLLALNMGDHFNKDLIKSETKE